MNSFAQDVRFAIRTLLKNPAFTLVAVMTLALGIGGNTAIFSAAEGIWLRPLPFTDISHVEVLGQQTPESSFWASLAAATYREWKDHSHSFAALSAYRETNANLTGAALPQRVQVAELDDGLLALMNMKPALGRSFAAEDFRPGSSVVMLSYGVWQAQFGGRGDVVGKTLQIDGQPSTIIGVMDKAADFPAATDLWRPLSFTAADWADTKGHRLHPLARLADGVTRDQATAELDALLRNLAAKAPADYERLSAGVHPLGDAINGNMTPGFLRVLMGAAGFVLLIACINLGNLQLSRATGRRREFSVRAALGCSRFRLARQMLTESMVLALAGAAAGLLLADWAVRLMVTSMPADTARQISGWAQMSIDGKVLLFTAITAMVSGLAAGLVPVARGYKFAPAEALKAGGTTTQAAPHRLRSLLVVGEAAVALTLLVGTVLVVEGFHHMIDDAQRFDPQGLLTMQVELTSPRYGTPQARMNFYSQALERMRSTPGVAGAVMFSAPPFSNNGVEWRRFRTAAMTETRRLPGAVLQSISPGFFGALNIPLLSGRDFSDSDNPNSLPVAIISDVMARRYWPGETPVGRIVYLRNGTTDTALTIVGVSGNVEYDWTNNAPEAVIYVPFGQQLPTTTLFAVRSVSRSASAGLVAPIRAGIAQLDPDLPLSNIKTLDRVMLESLAPLAQIGGLMSAFGVIALLLAAAGIYGMVSYAVTQRTHEIGIRMAIGAERSAVLRMVIVQMMRFAVAGAILGLLGAVALGRASSGFFFGVKAGDPLPFVLAFVVLIAVALLATVGPALRATRVDPMLALRAE